MSAAELLSACGRIDAAAAALRVFVIGCGEGAAETDNDNAATRQLTLRGLAEVIKAAVNALENARDGDDYHGVPLLFFAEMVWTAEQALWMAMEAAGEGAPSNADLCALLGLALQYHAEAVAERPALPVVAAAAGGKAARQMKGGAA